MAAQDPIASIDDAYAYYIRRTDRLLRTHFSQLMRQSRLDLSPEQWFILNRLYHSGPLSQIELSDRTFKDRANITRLVERLEAAGWIEREQDADDRRKQLASITRAGKKIVETLNPAILAARKRVYRNLTPADFAALKRIAAILEENIAAESFEEETPP